MKKHILLLLLTTLSGCGNESDPIPNSSAPCTSGTAQIGVYDGFLQIQCGCAEPAGTKTIHGQLLTCTIDAGDRVFFHYLGTGQTHQILSVGTPSFASGPLSDVTAAHQVTLDASGTYQFKDFTGLTGQIIVP